VTINLRMFIDRVVVPALLERFLREQQAAAPPPVGSGRDLPSPAPRV